MDIHRNSTAVVGDSYGFIGVDGDGDLGAITSKCFVDGVVDHLENHVVKTSTVIGVSDVHAGPFSDGIKALQNFDFA
jgi:hypothetical protein